MAALTLRQMVRNAQALGRALCRPRHPGRGEGLRLHVAATRSRSTSRASAAASRSPRRLESQDIIVNYNMLPGDQDPRNPSGLRIGVQEMTRFGMTPIEMGELAPLIADAIRGKAVKEAVNRLRGRFVEMRYV